MVGCERASTTAAIGRRHLRCAFLPPRRTVALGRLRWHTYDRAATCAWDRHRRTPLDHWSCALSCFGWAVVLECSGCMQYFERLKLVRERLERRDQRVLVHEMDQACPPSLGLRRMVKDTCGQKVGVVWWG